MNGKGLRAIEISAGNVEGHFSAGRRPETLRSQDAGAVAWSHFPEFGRGTSGWGTAPTCNRKSVGGRPGKED